MSVSILGDAAVIPRQPPVPRGLVHTLNKSEFEFACAALMHRVLAEFQPDLLVGIRTGGMVVAEAMARAASPPIAVMPVTCRRAATGVKSRLKVLPTVLGALPRPAVDGLRWLEHHLLTARRRSQSRSQQIDHAEASAVGHHFRSAVAPRVVVVDDAVDSGLTLATVLQLLREVCPAELQFRSAVVTVTLAQPAIEPDFVLYRGVLCRFPWSFDAAS